MAPQGSAAWRVARGVASEYCYNDNTTSSSITGVVVMVVVVPQRLLHLAVVVPQRLLH